MSDNMTTESRPPIASILISLSLAIGLTLAVGAANADDEAPPVRTVDRVDLERYVGRWYEIARMPNRFQDHCVRGNTAEYTLDEDGELKVVNRCYDEDGEVDEAEGVARIVDKESNSKLEVSFVSFLGWRPFWGDYWIIGLAEDYSWVVVGTPDRDYGWILARRPELAPADLEAAFVIAEDNGYDRRDFKLSLR